MIKWSIAAATIIIVWLTSQPTDGRITSVAQSTPEIVINELMYHPATGQDAHEFVELTNTGAITVDLSGWTFGDG